MMKNTLTFESIRYCYHTEQGEIQAVKNVSFSVREGEFLSIIGPSGCGKTTLLSMAAGLIKPSGGHILLHGKPVTQPSPSIGYMLQHDALFPWRSVYRNVTIGLELQGKRLRSEDKQRIYSLLKKYGLIDFAKAKPPQLSGGMRQRTALIRTLASDPEILLLDEPFSALDYQTRLEACDDVYRIISSEKKTAILVTHDISEAISLSDRVVVLSQRPATVKTVIEIPLRRNLSPLHRREESGFPLLFEKLYREVSHEKK